MIRLLENGTLPGVFYSGGGGGSSGEVTYPNYIESAFQEIWGMAVADTSDAITVDLVDVINASMDAGGGNPYSGENAFDPNAALTLISGSPLEEMQSIHDAYETVVTALSETTDWDTIVTKAVAELDSGVISETDITSTIASIVTTALSDSTAMVAAAVAAATSAVDDSSISDAVTAFEGEQENQHLRSIGRLASSLAQNVNSSAYVFAMAQAEYEFNKQVDTYRTQLKLKTYDGTLQAFVQSYVNKIRVHTDAYIRNHLSYEQFRTSLIDGSVRVMMQMLINRVDSYKTTTITQSEISRAAIIALKEQTDKDLEVDVNDAKWDMGILTTGSNILASIAGGTAAPTQPQPSTASSAIGGAMSGAATGAMLGSAIPGIGTGVGAIAGGVVGGLAGLLN